MKHKLLTVPLLSFALMFVFYHPIKSESQLKKISLTTTKQLISGLSETNGPPTTGLSMTYPADQTAVLDPSGTLNSDPYQQEFEQFVASVTNGQPDLVRGVFVPGVFAMEIIQQPSNNAAFVSSEKGVITQFKSAARHGVIGLLAHNYLSGDLFYDIPLDQEIRIVYGDGSHNRFRVSETRRFQKLVPSSLRSDLIDLETGERRTTAQVFNEFYRGENHVTFQTCLEAEGLSNWGLYFIIATPIMD